LHEDEIIAWTLVLHHNAAIINDVTEIYKSVMVHTDLQMCQRKFRPIKYTRRAVIVTQSSGRFFGPSGIINGFITDTENCLHKDCNPPRADFGHLHGARTAENNTDCNSQSGSLYTMFII